MMVRAGRLRRRGVLKPMGDRRMVIVATSQPELLRTSNSYETATADLLTRRDTLITRIDIDDTPLLVYWQRRRHG